MVEVDLRAVPGRSTVIRRPAVLRRAGAGRLREGGARKGALCVCACRSPARAPRAGIAMVRGRDPRRARGQFLRLGALR